MQIIPAITFLFLFHVFKNNSLILLLLNILGKIQYSFSVLVRESILKRGNVIIFVLADYIIYKLF